MKNNISKLLVVILIGVLLGVLSYIVWSKVQLSKGAQPPEISIGIGEGDLFQAYLYPGEHGLLEFTDSDVRNWTQPSGTNTSLKNNTNMYYSEENVSVQEIIESIEPEAGNEILLLFYSPGDENVGTGILDEGFYTYPDIGDLVDPDGTPVYEISTGNIDNFEIPAYRGFYIVSKENSIIWNINGSNEKADYTESIVETIADNITSGWILLPGKKNETDLSFLEPITSRLGSIWIQNGKNSFKKASGTGDSMISGYYMIWLELNEYTEPEGYTANLTIECPSAKKKQLVLYSPNQEYAKESFSHEIHIGFPDDLTFDNSNLTSKKQSLGVNLASSSGSFTDSNMASDVDFHAADDLLVITYKNLSSGTYTLTIYKEAIFDEDNENPEKDFVVTGFVPVENPGTTCSYGNAPLPSTGGEVIDDEYTYSTKSQ